jgi:hypothetical protein
MSRSFRILFALLFVLVLLLSTAPVSMADGPLPPPLCDPTKPPDQCPYLRTPVPLPGTR